MLREHANAACVSNGSRLLDCGRRSLCQQAFLSPSPPSPVLMRDGLHLIFRLQISIPFSLRIPVPHINSPLALPHRLSCLHGCLLAYTHSIDRRAHAHRICSCTREQRQIALRLPGSGFRLDAGTTVCSSQGRDYLALEQRNSYRL